MTAFEGETGLVRDVRRSEREIERITTWQREVDRERATFKEQLKALRDDVRALSGDVRSLRRTLIGLALSITVSALGFSLAVLSATGKI